MGNKIFEVSRIEGEYAYIKEYESDSSEELFIALALLPCGVDIGSRLSQNGFEFEIAD